MGLLVDLIIYIRHKEVKLGLGVGWFIFELEYFI